MAEKIDEIKKRFGIVGSDPMLDRAIDTAVQVAPIQLSALIIGESGSGKEFFPQIIHQFSQRKHKPYVAVNCGAIPEGTMDSELFGHEKGSFTGALADRKGYFEEADTGTIFLDEIGELPLATQAKLLRVLEKGEYMKVGSSVVKKTDVRIVAATNVNLEEAIKSGKFREDLFYRLNGIMIRIPPLRNRVADIPALFHKFTNDFSEANKMPAVSLTSDAKELLKQYEWPGNVRQLKNVAEQITVLAADRVVDAVELQRFLPEVHSSSSLILPGARGNNAGRETFENEREILYKVLFDMRREMADLKKLVLDMAENHGNMSVENQQILDRYTVEDGLTLTTHKGSHDQSAHPMHHILNAGEHISDVQASDVSNISEQESEETVFSIPDNEKELIRKALEKYNGNRRLAAQELGIAERTLYRKIESYGLK
ncbi:MAG: sigma-54 dependent transcriptional regulator [Bacteroidales bacterium]|nr:sigma-54 dependent transcriptional regulator [Bacteroidales bacterium]